MNPTRRPFRAWMAGPAAFLAAILTLLFCTSTYLHFSPTILRFERPRPAVCRDFRIDFSLPHLDAGMKYNVQTLLVRLPSQPLLLDYSLNDKWIGQVAVEKKAWFLDLPAESLREGANELTIRGKRKWDFDLVRIQNVFGHSSGRFSYLIVHRESVIPRESHRRFRPFPLYPALFFLVFFMIFRFILATGERRRPARLWLISVFFALPLVMIPLIPMVSGFRLLLSVPTLMVLAAGGCLALVEKSLWRAGFGRFRFFLARELKASRQGLAWISDIYTRSHAWALPSLLSLFTMALYLRTLLPGLGFSGDTAKFQLIGKVLGVPHATGYPLYVLLNKLFIQIPIRTVAYRANLMSAVFALLAVLLIYFTLRRIVESSGTAFCSAALFAFTQTFWSQALIAEVYTLNALLVVWVIHLLLKWYWTRRPIFFYGFLFFYALSFGNHMTMITLFPAFLIFVFINDRSIAFKAKTLWITLGCIVFGAAQYLLIYIRTVQHAPYVEYGFFNFAGFLRLITGRQFHQLMFSSSLPEILGKRLLTYGMIFHSNIPVWVMLLGFCGMFALFFRARMVFLLLFLCWVGESFFILNYTIPDIFIYFIPVYLVFVFFFAAGLQEVLQRLKKPLLARLLIAAVAAGIVWMAAENIAKVDMSGDRADDDRFTTLFDHIEDHAAIASDNYLDKMFVFQQMFLHLPPKTVHQFEIQSLPDTERQVRDWVLEAKKKDPVFRHSRDRRLYIVSKALSDRFRAAGIATVPVSFPSKIRKKHSYRFYRVVFEDIFFR